MKTADLIEAILYVTLGGQDSVRKDFLQEVRGCRFVHIKFHHPKRLWYSICILIYDIGIYIYISWSVYMYVWYVSTYIYILLEDAGAAKRAGCQAYLIGWQFSQIRLVGKNARRGLALVKAAVATWESHPVQPYGWTKSSTNGVQNLWIVPLPWTNRLRRNLSLSCFHVVLSLRSSCTVWSFCRQAE